MLAIEPQITLKSQIDAAQGPVILLNHFVVPHQEIEEFLRNWEADAAYFKRQPGYISAQMHRGLGDSELWVNYAVWESADDLARAVAGPEFKALIERHKHRGAPKLYQRAAIRNICVGTAV